MSLGNFTPPQNIEAEAAVLSVIFLDNRVLKDLQLADTDFYNSAHQEIYRCVLEMYEEREPIDTITLTNRLLSKKQLDKVGGVTYLCKLAALMPTTANVNHYAEIVKDKAVRRHFIASAIKIIQKTNDDEPLDEIRQIYRDEFKKDSSKIVSAAEVSSAAVKYIERIADTGLAGISTGFIDVDKVLRGYVPGNLYVLAARPGMGKTAFALNSSMLIAKSGTTCGIFELEMSDEQIGSRGIADIADLGFDNMLKPMNSARFYEAARQLSHLPIKFCFTSHINCQELRTQIEEMVITQGAQVIWVDYLQLIANRIHHKNREAEVSEISRTLKSCARDYSVPIIALAQLNRDCERRPNKRPILSDLRESGAIEQDADVVMLLYRDEIYHADTKDRGVAELIVSKNRHGLVRTVRLAFIAAKTRFMDLADAADLWPDNL
jgi:replicative DNA helicase